MSHPRWRLYQVDETVDAGQLFRANSFEPPAGEPTSYYSPGVGVTTTGSEPVDDAPRRAPRE